MTTVHLADVAAAIAALDIRTSNQRVKIYALSEMPAAIDDRACPCLAPSATNPVYVTDWDSQRISTQGNYRMTYTLNYKLYQAKIGSDRGLFAQYPALVNTAAAIVNAFLALTAVNGCKRLEIAQMPDFGNVVDPSGQQFHGATFALRVTEF